MKKAALYLIVMAVAAACSSKEVKQEPSVSDRSTAVPQASTGGSSSTTRPSQSVAAIPGNPLTDPNSLLSKRSVYFDFDSNAGKDEYPALPQPPPPYLTNIPHPPTHINC